MAKDIAQVFLDRYAVHDIDGMLSLFEPNGIFECVALGTMGLAQDKGRRFWLTMFDSVPDLSVSIRELWTDEGGSAAFADLTLSGCPQDFFLGIESTGKSFSSRQLHIFEVNGGGGLIKLTCFWDQASLINQLKPASLH